MQNNNSNSDLVSQGSLIWWTGIIVSDETWNANVEAKRWKDPSKLVGWGARYRVRIFGRHTAVKETLPDDKLELCEVIFPVTAGTGHGASWQSSNLREGSVVVGFYKDGIEANEPIIMGCIGNNDQTVLEKVQKNGFTPFSAFDDFVPWYNIVAEGADGKPITDPNGSVVSEANSDSTPSREAAQDNEFNSGDKKSLAVSSKCEVVKLASVSITIKNLIKDIEQDRARFDSWKAAVKKNDFKDINDKINLASETISGGIKSLIGDAQQFVLREINERTRKTFEAINPSQEILVKTPIDFAQQEIVCLFRAVIDNTLKIVGQFLANNILKYINVPLCAVENIIGTLLGKIVGFLRGGIQQALKVVESIVGVIDLGESILGFIQEVLEFSFCDPELVCPNVKEWDIWNGTGSDGFNVPDAGEIIGKARSTIANIGNTATSISNFFDPETIKRELDISTLLDDTVDVCNIGPILCGPPRVEIFGGGGTEAAGNAIVSATGQILGVDITNFGFDYKEEPFIKIVDACGKGTGAVAKVLTEKKPTSGIGNPTIRPGLDIGTIQEALFNKNKEEELRGATVPVKFSATRDFNSGTFFQFKIPGERARDRRTAGRRQFTISTADIKKNRTAEFVIDMAVDVDYSVEGFFNLSKERIKLDDDERLSEENTAGRRGDLFNAKRRRVPLSNKRLRIQDIKKQVQSNIGFRAGSTITLDDISLITQPPSIKIQYTNLSSANAPILYRKEDIKNYIPGTSDDEQYSIDDTRAFDPVGGNKNTSLLREAKKFLEKKGDRNSEGKKLFYRDAGGNNLNGILIIEDGFNEKGEKSDVRFSEDGRSIVSFKPTINNVFKVRLLYKDGLEQEERIFDKVRVGKKDFIITKEEFGNIQKSFTIKAKKQAFQDFEEPDGVYDDLVVSANKGYFYFNKVDKKYYFRVSPDEDSDISTTGLLGISSQKYNIRANKTRVKTLDQVVFTITTTGVKNGTELYWVINPKAGEITQSDFEFLRSDSGKGASVVVADTELYGKIVINNNQAKITKRINKTATVGDAFSVTLSRSIEVSGGGSEITPSPESLTESQVVTVVDDITSGGLDTKPTLPVDIEPIGIGSGTLPLIGEPDDGDDIPTPLGPPPVDIITPPIPPPPELPEFPPIEFDDPIPDVVITGVVILEPGIGYTYAPNGDTGGDERVYCPFDHTCFQDVNRNYLPPLRPDVYKCFSAGDKVTIPEGTTVVTEPRNGRGGGETIVGGAPYIMKEDGCITTPRPEEGDPKKDPLSAINDTGYPVDLCLCDIIIENDGFGYTENDTLVIEPSNGVKATFKVSPLGSITEVTIQEQACGFKERPTITIQSETGRNANLVPKFCIDRIPVDTVKEPGIFEEFITVIDCVGRVPEQDFFRIPD